MSASPVRGNHLLALVVAGLLVLCAPWSALAQPEAWTIGEGDVRVTCFLTVGGNFEIKTRSLSGTLASPAAGASLYQGFLSMDLSTLDSAIALRNDHLRNKYLEVAKGAGFATAIVDDLHLDGGESGASRRRTSFTGTLHLHGTSRAVAGQADITLTPGLVRVDASFPVTIADFGIADPRYLGVGVKNQVQVRVRFVATSARGQTP